MIKRVLYPPFIRLKGITKNDKGAGKPWRVAAGDTETVHGRPYTLQLTYDGHNPLVFYVTPDTVLTAFLNEVSVWALPHEFNAVFFHNLPFDLQALLLNHASLFTEKQKEFVIEHDDCEITCFVGKTWFARVKCPNGATVTLLDTRAFYKGSLKNVAVMVKSPYLKLDRPIDPRCRDLVDGEHARGCRCLGEADLTGDPEFEAYARQDVLAQWWIGKNIADLHMQYDVQPAVSLPHLGSRILRHRFFKHGEAIGFPPLHIVYAAELSFHGGKNAITVPAGWYGSEERPCYELDLRSAYGWAMTKLPSFLSGKWRAVEEIPMGQYGIVRVSGRTRCKWGAIFTHDFKPVSHWHGQGKRWASWYDPSGQSPSLRKPAPAAGGWVDFRNIWITQYELESALRHGCVEVSRCEGYVWMPDSDYSAMKEYVDFFWKMKNESVKDSVEYNFAKLAVNAVYGKFIQNMEVETDAPVGDSESVEEPTFKAGGMYCPPIATGITGMIRAKIHDLEHKYDALHTSTDAVKTLLPPDPEDLSEELGALSVEVSGRALLLRCKLYIHESFDSPKVKAAKHGFKGSLKQLRDAAPAWFRGEKFSYLYQHCWTIREAHRRKRDPVTPLDFQMVRSCLVPPDSLKNDVISGRIPV